MKDSTIEDLAYQIKQAKERNLPRPIVFLGAGASKTGDIPLAGEIVDDILDKYKNNPGVKRINDDDKTYSKLMECLMPSERNELLKAYIDRAKINVTHIYLAQLIKEGFVDYVLTVNFDNLMLRALALYNEFPPVYDMAILKDLTTTSFKEKSVLYLHGQHHGLWLLNTQEEMEKVKEFIPPILNKITNQRPWIFVGYSGGDPIFDYIVKLGRFDNGLYWICYKNETPDENVCANLLDKPNTNSFIIKGYDSDSFMLRLNQELKLPQPEIIDKPFTSLKNSLENIVDIDDEEHFKGVKERLEIVKTQVDTAINQFEKGDIETKENLKDEIDVDRLKKAIIDKRITKDYNEAEIAAIEEEANQLKNKEIDKQLANLYIDWGDMLHTSAKLNEDEILYKQSIEKFEKAATLNPKEILALINWGTALHSRARLKGDESLYRQSVEKFEKAKALDSKNHTVFYNWGGALLNWAQLKNDEILYQQGFEKLNEAIELGSSSYNLACAYAIKSDKKNALKNLENSLTKNNIAVQTVETDDDWKEFADDEDFKNLLNKFRDKKDSK